jgi:hypothetical protein
MLSKAFLKIQKYRVCQGFLEAAEVVLKIGSSLKPNKPPSENLACPNLWNALYVQLGNILHVIDDKVTSGLMIACIFRQNLLKFLNGLIKVLRPCTV